jgi:hypothetical protein
MLSIPGLREGFKRFLASDLYVAGLIVLAGLAGFGLGKLSANAAARPAVRIEYPSENAASAQQADAAQDLTGTAPEPDPKSAARGAQAQEAAVSAAAAHTGAYVASRNGERYYPSACSGANRIAEANKIWFNTKQEAEAAGYTPAVNCDFSNGK